MYRTLRVLLAASVTFLVGVAGAAVPEVVTSSVPGGATVQALRLMSDTYVQSLLNAYDNYGTVANLPVQWTSSTQTVYTGALKFTDARASITNSISLFYTDDCSSSTAQCGLYGTGDSTTSIDDWVVIEPVPNRFAFSSLGKRQTPPSNSLIPNELICYSVSGQERRFGSKHWTGVNMNGAVTGEWYSYKYESPDGQGNKNDYTSSSTASLNALMQLVKQYCPMPRLGEWKDGTYWSPDRLPVPHSDVYNGLRIVLSQVQGEIDRTKGANWLLHATLYDPAPTGAQLGGGTTGEPAPGGGFDNSGTGNCYEGVSFLETLINPICTNLKALRDYVLDIPTLWFDPADDWGDKFSAKTQEGKQKFQYINRGFTMLQGIDLSQGATAACPTVTFRLPSVGAGEHTANVNICENQVSEFWHIAVRRAITGLLCIAVFVALGKFITSRS